LCFAAALFVASMLACSASVRPLPTWAHIETELQVKEPAKRVGRRSWDTG